MLVRLLCLGISAITVVVGASAQETAAPGRESDAKETPGSQDSRKLLEEVLMARLTRELALDGEQTVLMVRHLAEYRERMAALRRERMQLVRALRESVRESKDEATIETRLNALLTHDQKLAEARTAFLNPEDLELTAWQQARLFLFVQDFEGDMRRLLKRAQDRRQGAANPRDRKNPHTEMAPPNSTPEDTAETGTENAGPVQ